MNVLYLLLQRILEEDEEIEQEKIKQTLDLQFHKQRQSLHSMDQEKQTYTMRAATICGQAINIPKATTPPVHCIQDHSLPTECFHEHPPACGFAVQPPADHPYLPLIHQHNSQLPQPPLPPKPVQCAHEHPMPAPTECFHEHPLTAPSECFHKDPLLAPTECSREHPSAGFAAQPPRAQPYNDPSLSNQNNNQSPPPPPLPPKPSPTPPTPPVETPVEHLPASGFAAQLPGAQPWVRPVIIQQNDNQLPPWPPKPSPTLPTPPVEHKQSPSVEYFQERLPAVEHSLASGFAARLNVSPEVQPCVGPTVIQQNDNQLPPCLLKPGLISPVSPSGSEIHQLPPLHAGGLPDKPPFSQRYKCHLLSSQNPPQRDDCTKLPHQKPILTQDSVDGEIEQQILKPQCQQASRMQASVKVPSSPQERLKSPSEDQCPMDDLSAPLPSTDPIDLEILPFPKMSEAYEGSNHLDQDVESVIWWCSTRV